MTNKIVCTHLSQQESRSAVTCDVVYWPCQCQQKQMAVIAQGTSSLPNTVNIDLPEILPRSDYCYGVNASNGTITIIIEGTIESSECMLSFVYELSMSCNDESHACSVPPRSFHFLRQTRHAGCRLIIIC